MINFLIHNILHIKLVKSPNEDNWILVPPLTIFLSINILADWDTQKKMWELRKKCEPIWLTEFLWITVERVFNRIDIYVSDCSQRKVLAKLNYCFLQFLVEILCYFVICLCTAMAIPFSWQEVGQNIRQAANGPCVVYPKWSCSQIVYFLHPFITTN